MKTLIYDSASILVGDDVAQAVLHYAAILASTRESDVVDIPTCDEAGCAAVASVVLGPGVPVMALGAPEDAMEQEDTPFVDEITCRVGEVMAGKRH